MIGSMLAFNLEMRFASGAKDIFIAGNEYGSCLAVQNETTSSFLA